MDGSLVTQINVLSNCQTLGIFVGEDDGPGGFGFSHHVGGSGVVKEAIVNTTGIPGIDTLCASERRVSN